MALTRAAFDQMVQRNLSGEEEEQRRNTYNQSAAIIQNINPNYATDEDKAKYYNALQQFRFDTDYFNAKGYFDDNTTQSNYAYANNAERVVNNIQFSNYGDYAVATGDQSYLGELQAQLDDIDRWIRSADNGIEMTQRFYQSQFDMNNIRGTMDKLNQNYAALTTDPNPNRTYYNNFSNEELAKFRQELTREISAQNQSLGRDKGYVNQAQYDKELKEATDKVRGLDDRVKAIDEILESREREDQYNQWLSTLSDADFDGSYRSTYKGDGTTERTVLGQNGYVNQELSNYGDILYDYINGDEHARQVVNELDLFGSQKYLSELTDDEKAVFNNLYRKDRNEAYKYIEFLEKDLTLRDRTEREARAQKLSEAHPVMASIDSVIGKLMSPISVASQITGIISGDLDQNSWMNQFSYIPTKIRSTVSNKIEEHYGTTGSWMYNQAMSVADNVARMLITGGTSEAAVLALCGTQVFSDAVVNGADEGKDVMEILVDATAQSLIEVLTESIGTEQVFKFIRGDRTLKQLAVSALSESVEEGLSDILNDQYDILKAVYTGHESEIEKEIDKYIAAGLSAPQATARVFGDHIKEAGLDMLGGFISGFAMSGSGALANDYQNYSTAKTTPLEEVIEAGKKLDPASSAYKAAESLENQEFDGKNKLQEIIAKARQINLNNMEETLEVKESKEKADKTFNSVDPEVASVRLDEMLQADGITDAMATGIAISYVEHYMENLRETVANTNATVSSATSDQLVKIARGNIGQGIVPTVQLMNGEYVNFNDIQWNDANEETIWREALNNFKYTYASNNFINAYKSVDVAAGVFAKIYTEVYEKASQGFSKADVFNMVSQALNVENIDGIAIPQSILETAFKDGIDSAVQINKGGEKLTQMLADKFGVEVEFKNGIVTKDGQALNGQYNRATGKIEISRFSRQPMAVVFCHEVTHAMKDFNPTLYNFYEGAIIDKMKKEGQYDVLLDSLKQNYPKGDKNLKTWEAELNEELVAYGSEQFLTSEEFVRELEKTDPALASRLRRFLFAYASRGDLLGKTRASIYTAFREDEDFFNALEDVWFKGLSDMEKMEIHSDEIRKSVMIDVDFNNAEATNRRYEELVDSDPAAAEQMLEDYAMSKGYAKLGVMYHGTSEYFNVFRLGREGIHLGNLEQAEQVSRLRYEDNSAYTTYTTDEILSKLDTIPDSALREVLEKISLKVDVGEYQGELSDKDSVRKYIETAQKQGRLAGLDEIRYYLPTFDRKVGENIMELYTKISNPFVVNGDLGAWYPSEIAQLLLNRDSGKTSQMRYSRKVDITGSDIRLFPYERATLNNIINGVIPEDRAFSEIRDILAEHDYDGIKYLNEFEGDKNSYSFIALSPNDVKLADMKTFDRNGNMIPLTERFNEKSDDIRKSVMDLVNENTKPIDVEYYKLIDAWEKAKSKETKTEAESKLREYVMNYAAEHGFPTHLFHGTPAFGYKGFNRDKTKTSYIFTTPHLEMATSYAGGENVRTISSAELSTKALELNEKAIKAFNNLYEKITEEADFPEEDLEILRDNFDSYIQSVQLKTYTPEEAANIYAKRVSDFTKDLDSPFVDMAESYALDTFAEYAHEAGKADFKGTYELYADTDNFLEVDAEGLKWDEVPVYQIEDFGDWFDDVYAPEHREKYFDEDDNTWVYEDEVEFNGIDTSTDVLAAYADYKGYSGLLVKNVEDALSADESLVGDDYIFFNPVSQLRSADLITYYGDGTPIPLTERFKKELDEKNAEEHLLFSVMEDEYNWFDDKPDVKSVLEGVDISDTTITDAGWEAIAKHVCRLDKKLLKESGKGLSLDERIAIKELKKVYAYWKKNGVADFDSLTQIMGEVFLPIIENIKYTDKSFAIRKQWAGTKFIISDTDAKNLLNYNMKTLNNALIGFGISFQTESSYQKSQQQAKADAELVKEQAEQGKEIKQDKQKQTVRHFDDAWLSFNGDIREGIAVDFGLEEGKDVPERIDMFIDALFQDKAHETFQAYTGDEAKTIAYTMALRAYERMLVEMKVDPKKVERATKQRVLAESSKQIAEIRDKYEALWSEKLATQDEIFESKKAKLEENANKSKYIRAINREMKRFNQKVINRTKKSHIAPEYMRFVGEIGELIDLTTSRKSAKTNEMLIKMAEEYKRLAAQDLYQQGEYDPTVENYIRDIAEAVGDKRIVHLTSAELKKVYTALRAFLHLASQDSTFIDPKIAESLVEGGEQTIKDIESTKGRGDTAVNKYITSSLAPYREIARITGYNYNDPLYKSLMNLMEGELEEQSIKMEISRIWADMDVRSQKTEEGKKRAKEYKKAYENMDREWTTVQMGGEQVRVTKAMKLAIYMHALNPDNIYHIVYGGFRVPDEKLYKRGRFGAAYDAGKTHHMTLQELQAIPLEDGFEKWFVEKSRDYYENFSKDKINETSLKLEGFARAEVKNYYPITVYDKNIGKYYNPQTGEVKAESIRSGALKPRVTSSAEILLNSINRDLTRSQNFLSRYAGLAVPIRDFERLWTIKPKDGDSLQKVVANHWGGVTADYINKFLENLKTGASTREENEIINRIRSKSARAVLSVNPSVSMKQFASFPTAIAELDYGSVAKAIKNLPTKIDYELINKYTPVLWMRMQGMSTQELAEMNLGYKDTVDRFADKLPWLTGWIQAVDVKTVGTLWYATENYIEKTTGLTKENGDEFYEAVAKKFNDVVIKTQPNYSVLGRPDILRNQSSLTKALFMFKTQPLQNFGIMFDSFGELRARQEAYINAQKNGENVDVARADLKKAQKRFFRSVSSQVVQTALFTSMTLLANLLLHRWDKYEDDETGEFSWAKVAEEFGFGFADSFFGNSIVIDWVEDLADYATRKFAFGEDPILPIPSVFGIDTLGEIEKELDKAIDYLSKGESEKAWLQIKKMAENISQVSGIPAKNIENVIMAGWNYATDIAEQKAPWDTDETSNAQLIRRMLNGEDVDENMEKLRDNAILDSSAIGEFKKFYTEGDEKTQAKIIKWLKDYFDYYDEDVKAQLNAWSSALNQSYVDANEEEMRVIRQIWQDEYDMTEEEVIDHIHSIGKNKKNDFIKRYHQGEDVETELRNKYYFDDDEMELFYIEADNSLSKHEKETKLETTKARQDVEKDVKEYNETVNTVWEDIQKFNRTGQADVPVEKTNAAKYMQYLWQNHPEAQAEITNYAQNALGYSSKASAWKNTTKGWAEKDTRQYTTEKLDWDSIGRMGEGNIDLYTRPTFITGNNTVETIDPMIYEENGRYVLIPRIVSKNGKAYRLSDDEAIEWYKDKGKYLGKFSSKSDAQRYANELEVQQDRLY